MRTMPIAFDHSPEMRVTDDAKDEVRLAAMFPAQRGRKQAPPAKRKRRRAGQKFSSRYAHFAAFRYSSSCFFAQFVVTV